MATDWTSELEADLAALASDMGKPGAPDYWSLDLGRLSHCRIRFPTPCWQAFSASPRAASASANWCFAAASSSLAAALSGLSLCAKKHRFGRNPKTGVPHPISGRPGAPQIDLHHAGAYHSGRGWSL